MYLMSWWHNGLDPSLPTSQGGIRLSAYRSRGKCLLKGTRTCFNFSWRCSPSLSVCLYIFLSLSSCFVFGLKCEAQFFKSYMKLTNFVQAPSSSPSPQLQRSRRRRMLHLQTFTCQLCSWGCLTRTRCTKATPASDTVRAERQTDGQRDDRRDERSTERPPCLPIDEIDFLCCRRWLLSDFAWCLLHHRRRRRRRRRWLRRRCRRQRQRLCRTGTGFLGLSFCLLWGVF